mgnify:CR=1 FL=1
MRTTLKISEIVTEWLENIDVKEITRKNYNRKISLWFRWLHANKIDPRSAQTKHVIAYKDHLIKTHHSSFTANGYMIVIKLFYKYCAAKRYCDNIAQNVKSGFRMTGKNKIPLTMDQARTLLQSVDTSTVKGKRDRLMIALMLFNGLRTCEVERINIEDVGTREGVPVVYLQRKGKVDKNDMVVLHQKAVEYFEDYVSGRDFDCKDPLFISHRDCDRGKVVRINRQTIARMVKQRLRKIGIDDKKISAHSLRHTFGSLLVEQGIDMEDIRELMGHSSTMVTKIYVELVQQRKMLHCSPSMKMIDQLIAG